MAKRKAKRHSILFIPAFILLLLGILVFGKVGRCQEKTTGVITGNDDKVTISYIAGKKKIDSTPTLYMGMVSKNTEYKVGEPVEILYNKRDHKNFVIKDENFTTLSYILLGLGFALFVTDSVAGNSLPESVVFRTLNKEISKNNK